MDTEKHRLLSEAFGFKEFREGQERIVDAVLAGEDCIGVLPTGGGKSLCFQLPALMREGLTLVVSPLIALMKDQVDGLLGRNISAACINSGLESAEWAERHRRLSRGEYKIVYVAPERFRNDTFLAALRNNRIALLAVDEAHCISMWGHDFRPDYTRLREVAESLGSPQILALTATATPEVRADIARALGLGRGKRSEPRTVVGGFSRPNLYLSMKRVSSENEKRLRTLALLNRHRTGIVYCATRGNVEKVCAHLQAAGIRAAAYHAGLPDEARKRTQEAFIEGRIDAVAATSAFGMGIDRGDLRTVVHWDIPGSLEAYYQEAGRAGRDGAPSHCEILYSFADVRTQEFFLEGANPPPALVEQIARTLGTWCKKGPVPLDYDRLHGQLGPKVNKMAVETALGLLEREGLFRRIPGNIGNIPAVEPLAPERSLAPLFDALREKAAHDRSRLSLLLRYTGTRSCRHKEILAYFEDTAKLEECSACDNCAQHRNIGTPPRALGEQERVDVLKTLSCAARLHGRFGAARIAQVLKGSKDKAVLGAGLDRLSTYGLLSDRPTAKIRQLIDALLDAGCLATSDGEFPTVRLTEQGRDVMQQRTEIALPLPPLDSPKAKAPSSKSKRRTGPPAQTAPEAAEPLTEAEQTRYEQLRSLRTELARRHRLPPYVIFTNATLDELARRPPSSREALRTIRGLGDAKISKFGDDLLRCIEQTRK